MVLNSAESVLFTFNEFQQLVGQFPVHSLGFFFISKSMHHFWLAVILILNFGFSGFKILLNLREVYFCLST